MILAIIFHSVGTHASIDWYEFHLNGKLMLRDLTSAPPQLLEENPNTYDEAALLEIGIPEHIVTLGNPAHPQSQFRMWCSAIQRALFASIGNPISEGGTRPHRSEGTPNQTLLLQELSSTMANYHFHAVRKVVHLDHFFAIGKKVSTPKEWEKLKSEALWKTLEESGKLKKPAPAS